LSLEKEYSTVLPREYLTNLITGAVTGKFDARDVARSLPDEIPEFFEDVELSGVGEDEILNNGFIVENGEWKT